MRNFYVGCLSILLMVLLVIAGFLYRYNIENHSAHLVSSVSSSAPSEGEACTQDAKVCPDGSAVGRTGPNCSFATCPLPNIQLTSASTTIAFVLPDGYKRNIVLASDPAQLASYIQSTNVIDVYMYPISAGQTASQTMLSHTYFDSSNQQATSTSEFQTVTEGSNTFYEIVTGQSSGEVHSSYYLYEPNDVLRFDITEYGVQNANDTNLNPNSLPQHQALQQMLATLQVSD